MAQSRGYQDTSGPRPGPEGVYDYQGMSVRRYLATRIPSLKPPMHPIPNPFKTLALLNTKQWLFFLCGFAGWTWDAFDFFTVTLTVGDLAATFGKSNKDITLGITLVLLLRTVGAIIFGLLADRFGNRIPFCFNLVLFILFELATGFCQTYEQFLGVRSLYGISMGGIYGMAASLALEDTPAEARGIISGMLQQGYAFGYLLATAFARGLVNTTSHGWRPLYWFGAGPPVLIIIFRLLLPETDTFIARQKVRASGESVGKTFVKEGKIALKKHWKILVYLVLLMAGFNFMAHGSQDLYPTMLQNQFLFNANQVTVTQVVANVGAMVGGTTIGYLSQSLGRRFSIIAMCILGGAILYPYGFVSNPRVIAPAFFEQFCVQGAWGVIPIMLMELSPGGFRAFVVGVSYQMGNLISSASSTIEATIGERYPLEATVINGKLTDRYNYGKVIAIFMGAVFAYTILLTLLGPEALGKRLDVEHDEDMLEIAPSLRASADGAEKREYASAGSGSDEEKSAVPAAELSRTQPSNGEHGMKF